LRSIVASEALLKKIYLPKYIIPISTIISHFIFFMISMIDLILIIAITGNHITINIIYAPIYLILFFIFSCGVSLVLATITVFFRDIEHIYGVLIMAIHFFSAVFYPPEIIPSKFQFILTYNPIYQFIKGFRDVVYIGTSPDLINMLICSSVAITSLILGLLIFKSKQDKFILHM
jgi:ABC-type polysaccharide/polyol phosphate export permease